MIDITILGISAIVLTGIFVQAVKVLEVPKKFLPIISLGIGVILVCGGTLSLSFEAIITGIIIGATTCGLYDQKDIVK